MQIRESLYIALDVIRTHKMRSFLTLLGIIIGVTAIIGMQSLIKGLQLDIQRKMEQLGANVFQVQKMPAIRSHHDKEKYRNRKNITILESNAIEKYCSAVTLVGPETWHFGVTAKYKDKKTSPTLAMAGSVPAFFPNNGYFIKEGRAFNNIDIDHNRNVVILGIEVVEDLFPFQNPIGESILIDNYRYQVIGIIEEQGSAFGDSKDNRLIIPLSVFLKRYGKNRSLNITVQAESPEMIETAKEQVVGVLRTVRKVPLGESNDFEIWSSNTLIEKFNNMTRAIRIGAIVIVSFSLLVAGIGIMNIMLVSIRERTREIGIRLAIGARSRDILSQFLVEAILLSEFGGIIGIITGIGIGQLVALVTPIPAVIPVWTVILGFGFCSFVGLIFGIYPAIKASRLDPIQALRYE
jgi:putative ABC transport system permease protein